MVGVGDLAGAWDLAEVGVEIEIGVEVGFGVVEVRMAGGSSLPVRAG